MKDLTNLKEFTLVHGSEEVEKLTQQQYEQRKADALNSIVGDLNTKDGYNCDICNNRGYTAEVKYYESCGYFSEVVIPCKCTETRSSIRKMKRSGLGNIITDYTFGKYEDTQPWQKTIKDAAKRFCKDEESNFFFIGGQSGIGKTHLCCAICREYLLHNNNVKYMLWRDEIVKLKALVNKPEEYSELITPLKKTKVLYIDDLFKCGKGEDGKTKRPTAGDVNVAFEIINYRYNNPKLITIISSERTLTDLIKIDEAIAGRIAEKSKPGGYCLSIKKDKSRNWRLKDCTEI